MSQKRFGMNDYFGVGQTAYPPLILDRLSVRPYAAWSSSRRLTRRWTGPIVTGFRSTDGEQRDFYGKGRLGLVDPNEIREFCGWNLVNWSCDLRNTAEAGSSRLWANSITGAGVAPTATLVAGGGPGGYDATRLQFSLGGGTTTGDITRRVQSVITPIGSQFVHSFRIRSYDGVSTYRMHAVSPTGATVGFDATPGWTTVEVPATAISSSISFGLGLRGGQTPANANTADVLVSEVQVELASARSTYDHREGTAADHVIRRKMWEQMGTGLHFEQSNSVNMPYMCFYGVPVTENSIQSASFVAAENRRMTVPASKSTFRFLHTTGGTVMAVHRAAASATTTTIIGTGGTASAPGVLLDRSSTTRAFASSAQRIDVAGVATNTRSVQVTHTGSTTTANCIVVWSLDPDNATPANRSRPRVNGVALTGDNALSGTPFVEDSTGDLTLGGTLAATQPYEGSISDVAIWQGSPPEDDIEITEADAIDLWSMA